MTDNINKKINDENLDVYEKVATDNDIPVSMYDLVGDKGYSYTKLSDKYNDIVSSAVTLLIVGIAGIILLFLVIKQIIPIPLNSETSWLFESVLGGVFIIFIIAGIISFMHAKQVKIDAEAEDKLISEILNWSDNNLSVSFLDKNLDIGQPNEILYFGRADKIKDILMHQFEEADEALIYEMTEQIYQKLYENEN